MVVLKKTASYLCLFIKAILYIYFLQSPVFAEQESIEEMIEEFGDENYEIDKSNIGDGENQFFGYIKSSSLFYLTDNESYPDKIKRKDLGELKLEVKLNFEIVLSEWHFNANMAGYHDFACQINGREDYDDAYLEDSEMEFELGEIYIEKNVTPFLDIKIGRQIISWGTSESFRVVDVINPIDQRTLGRTDLKDLRLPTTMTRIDLYSSVWNLTGLAIHEIRHNKTPVAGSPYYPSDSYLPPTEQIDTSIRNTQFGLALSGRFEGWDALFYFADIYDQDPYFDEGVSKNVQKYPRILMFGTGLTFAFGDVLFKTEAAYFDKLKFSNLSEKDKSKIKILAGIEYSGIKDTTVSIELLYSQILSFEKELELEPDNEEKEHVEYAVKIEKKYLNEMLILKIIGYFNGIHLQDGAYERLEAEYDISDKISVGSGVILYQAGDNEYFKKISNNDSIYANIKLSF